MEGCHLPHGGAEGRKGIKRHGRGLGVGVEGEEGGLWGTARGHSASLPPAEKKTIPLPLGGTVRAPEGMGRTAKGSNRGSCCSGCKCTQGDSLSEHLCWFT